MKNKAINVLSCRVTLLFVMSVKVSGFKRLKNKYESYPEFEEIYITLKDDQSNCVVDGYYFYEGYLFQDNKFCVPKTSIHDFLVWEIHTGGLSEHFGRNKTIEEVKY